MEQEQEQETDDDDKVAPSVAATLSVTDGGSENWAVARRNTASPPPPPDPAVIDTSIESSKRSRRCVSTLQKIGLPLTVKSTLGSLSKLQRRCDLLARGALISTLWVGRLEQLEAERKLLLQAIDSAASDRRHASHRYARQLADGAAEQEDRQIAAAAGDAGAAGPELGEEFGHAGRWGTSEQPLDGAPT